MNYKTDAITNSLPYGYLECAVKGRQVMDIAFPASLILEKGMDMMSSGCVAQADIKKYYDHLNSLLLAAWMSRQSYFQEPTCTFFLLQL